LVEIAQDRGFVGLVFDGADVETAIRSERDVQSLDRAVQIAQRHDEKIWAERFARRICDVDPAPVFRVRLASILAAAGQLGEAENLLAGLPTDSESELSRQVRGVLNAKAGRAEQAMAIFDALPGRLPGFHPAPIVLPTANEMLEQCTLQQMKPFLTLLAQEYPAHLLVRSFSLRYHLLSGDWDTAHALAKISEDAFKHAPTFDRRSFAEAAAFSLELLGWTNELFDFVRDTIAKDSVHWSLYDRASHAARATGRETEFARIIAAIPSAERASAEALSITCRWHVDENRLDEASRLLDEIRPLSADLFLKSRLYLRLYARDQDQIDAAFDACVKCGIPMLGPAVAYGIHSYYYNCSLARLQHCLTKLEPLAVPAPNSVHFWQTYMRCLIAVDKASKARQCYFSLPPGLANGAVLKPFSMFFDTKKKRHDKARKDWGRYIRDTRHLCVNAPSSYPRTVRLNYAEPPGAVLLFVTLFNAMDYVESFLDHYRALGVDHFFVVDNASTDGSLEKLCEQPDVSVFSNPESFAGSAFGVLWINHLMQRFGVNHWCFHVDIDEYFVFPDYDGSRTLQDLLSYCEDRGFGCVPAIELDMYPEYLADRPDVDPFVASCYFDVDYVVTESEMPPYVMIQGGLRQRLTGLPLSMQKSPLVLMAPDVRYIECNHSTTHLPVADLSGALLHYKFVGDIRRRVDDAISRAEHFAGAISYRRLDRAVGALGEAKSLLSHYSCRYAGPVSLLQHGLINTSAGWSAYRMPHSREKIGSGAIMS